MSATTKEIKNKIDSVENIQQITRAMQLMSVSKMRTATNRAVETRPYAQRAREVLENVTTDRSVSHPLLTYNESADTTLAVVLASDKGLCGSFNANVRKQLEQLMETSSGPVAVIAVGSEVATFARRLGCDLVAEFTDFDENTTLSEIGGLFTATHEAYLSGDYRRTVVVYSHYESALSQTPLTRQLFPVDPDNMGDTLAAMETGPDDTAESSAERSVMTNYLFEPSESGVAHAILPRLSRVRLYQALLESQASEHSARMFAMKNATENAEEMAEDLETDYNRARQEEVTQEIAEISSAANALR